MTDDERAVYDAVRAHKRIFTGNALDALSQPDWDEVAAMIARGQARWKPASSTRPTLSARSGPRKAHSRADEAAAKPGRQK